MIVSLVLVLDRWNSLDSLPQQQSQFQPATTQPTSQPQEQTSSTPSSQVTDKTIVASPPPGFGNVFPGTTALLANKEDVSQQWRQGNTDSFGWCFFVSTHCLFRTNLWQCLLEYFCKGSIEKSTCCTFLFTSQNEVPLQFHFILLFVFVVLFVILQSLVTCSN